MPSWSRRACALLPAALLVACFAAAPAGAATVTREFGYSGGAEELVVPAGVTALDVVAVGANGGNGGGLGETAGRGGRVSGTVAVTPGQRLWVLVGEPGVHEGCGMLGDPSSPPRAFNGGGGGGGINSGCSYHAAGGGGATDLRTCAPGAACDGAADPLGRLVVAGGGGGGGRMMDQPSGAGGDAATTAPTIGGENRVTTGGGAGGEDAGGAPGSGENAVPGFIPAAAGRLAAGGDG